MKTLQLLTINIAGILHLCLTPLATGAGGDVDLTFVPGTGVNGPVSAVALQPDGRIIIAGQFTTVKGLARANVARPSGAHSLLVEQERQARHRRLQWHGTSFDICAASSEF